MFGKTTELTPLAARKQLLLVESELNRVQLVNELRELKHGLQELKAQVEVVGSMAATAAKWAETFTKIRGAFTHEEKPSQGKSWVGTLFNGLRTCATLFGTFRSRPS
ncbi:MAG TPA: hypothetical protein VGO57_17675 [Verrucomicrobiae bacterium]|jgi:hypothetical protein